MDNETGRNSRSFSMAETLLINHQKFTSTINENIQKVSIDKKSFQEPLDKHLKRVDTWSSKN
ncbi:MAG TPA: hypothetical protein DCG75_05505 [Bacteroidales bacterium]|nr:hypothetical protein [Bacteroidales bacterium]